MGKPTIDQILVGLKNEVMLGRAYLTIANGLRDADAVVFKSSPTFFGLAFEASLQMSQMYAAKLYDKTSKAVTVKSLLDRAKLESATFKHGTPEQVSLAVKDAEKRIAGLQDILVSVQKRRNEAIAHLDPGTVVDPAGSRKSRQAYDSRPQKSVRRDQCCCQWGYASLARYVCIPGVYRK